MNKRELVAAIARKTDFTNLEINSILGPVMVSILEALQRGETININGFGRFELKFRRERNILHPRTKKPILIPERVGIAFIVTEKFRVDDAVLIRLRKR